MPSSVYFESRKMHKTNEIQRRKLQGRTCKEWERVGGTARGPCWRPQKHLRWSGRHRPHLVWGAELNPEKWGAVSRSGKARTQWSSWILEHVGKWASKRLPLTLLFSLFFPPYFISSHYIRQTGRWLGNYFPVALYLDSLKIGQSLKWYHIVIRITGLLCSIGAMLKPETVVLNIARS